MGTLHTHYDNLCVKRNAPSAVIRSAYKILAQEYHPDKNKKPDATRIMQIINESYAILSDPAKRADHDRWIDKQEKNPALLRKDKSFDAYIDNLRALHRADLHQLRKAHALEVEGLKRRVKFDKKWNIMIGVLLSIPIHLIFSNIDDAINKAHADPVAVTQQGGSHVKSIGQTHGESSWREHSAERITKPPRTHPGIPKASR
jgi:curved DNA-binding protein CbpA